MAEMRNVIGVTTTGRVLLVTDSITAIAYTNSPVVPVDLAPVDTYGTQTIDFDDFFDVTYTAMS
jgi:hypothetical protein